VGGGCWEVATGERSDVRVTGNWTSAYTTCGSASMVRWYRPLSTLPALPSMIPDRPWDDVSNEIVNVSLGNHRIPDGTMKIFARRCWV
jgi:hypothetical protein